MLVKDDSKSSEPEPAKIPQPAITVETPPPYSPAEEINLSPTSLRPTNYISISRANESVRGSYAIDPTLVIPDELLPPLSPEETEDSRSNLRVYSRNGSVNADVYLVSTSKPQERNSERKRATLSAKAQNGSVRVRLHRTGINPPFCMDCYSANGSAVLRIPRSFRGLIIAKTHNGTSRLSDGVTAQARTLSDVGGVHRVYIGDYSAVDIAADEVVLESKNGGIRVLYDDEQEPSLMSSLLRWFAPK